MATGQPGSSCQGCLLCDELTLLQSRGLCGLCHSLRSCILNSYWSNHELVFPELAAPLEDALMRCWQIRSGSSFVCVNPNWNAGTEGILYIISETSRIFELEKRESYSLLIWNRALVFSDPTSEQLRTARLPAVGAEVFGVGLAGLVVDRVLGMQSKLWCRTVLSLSTCSWEL